MINTIRQIDNTPEVNVDHTVTVMLCEQRPVTIRDVAARLGDRRTERASAILERLTANGTLARFKAGLSEYFAVPKEALIGDGPSKGTIIADSVRNVLLECRYRLAK